MGHHPPLAGQQVAPVAEVMTEGTVSTIQWVFIVVGALALIYIIYKFLIQKKHKK